MTFEQHSLTADALTEWAGAIRQATRPLVLLAAVWAVVTREPWEGAVMLATAVPSALLASQLLLARARWHARRMRKHVDGLGVRRGSTSARVHECTGALNRGG